MTIASVVTVLTIAHVYRIKCKKNCTMTNINQSARDL